MAAWIATPQRPQLPDLRALMRGDSRLSPHSRFHTGILLRIHPRLNGRRTHHANRQRD